MRSFLEQRVTMRAVPVFVLLTRSKPLQLLSRRDCPVYPDWHTQRIRSWRWNFGRLGCRTGLNTARAGRGGCASSYLLYCTAMETMLTSVPWPLVMNSQQTASFPRFWSWYSSSNGLYGSNPTRRRETNDHRLGLWCHVWNMEASFQIFNWCNGI